MKINNLEYIKNKELFLPKDENNREIYIYNLKNCKFTGNNLFYPNILIYSNDELYNPINEKIMSLEIENQSEYDFNLNNINNIEFNPVFFFIYNTDNYYHFIYDTLPYLISFKYLIKKIPNIKLLMNYPNSQQKKLYKFVLEFLEILGIKENDILMVDENTEYSNVYISISYTHDIDSNLPPRNEIYDFYKNIVKTIPIIKNTPENIYISRRSWIHGNYSNIGTNYTQKRKLVNEDELVNLLNEKGFVEIFTENLSTVEKISYFYNAKYVIGAIGGGICNVLFSPPETKLMALISPTFLDINKRFIYSLNKVNVQYFTDTSHTEIDDFKTNMRIKTNTGIIGEIEKVNDDSVIISYLNENVSGWNSQMIYNKIEIEKSNIIALDYGLNSPWKINLEKINLYI